MSKFYEALVRAGKDVAADLPEQPELTEEPAAEEPRAETSGDEEPLEVDESGAWDPLTEAEAAPEPEAEAVASEGGTEQARFEPESDDVELALGASDANAGPELDGAAVVEAEMPPAPSEGEAAASRADDVVDKAPDDAHPLDPLLLPDTDGDALPRDRFDDWFVDEPEASPVLEAEAPAAPGEPALSSPAGGSPSSDHEAWPDDVGGPPGAPPEADLPDAPRRSGVRAWIGDVASAVTKSRSRTEEPPEEVDPRIAESDPGVLEELLDDSEPIAAPIRAPETADRHLVSLFDPNGFEAEQYRNLRAVVEQLRPELGLQVFAVSSAAPGDGKTTTTLNLAGVLSQASGANVVVVDVDLRRPGVCARLGVPVPAERNVVRALENPALLAEDLVLRIPDLPFGVIPAGPPQLSPYDLLKAPRLGEMLDELRQVYDWVIVDTPPMVPMADCRLISAHVQGLLVVVAANKTPRRVLEQALEAVDPDKVLGFVFNSDDRLLPRYYEYRYYGRTDPRHGFFRRLWERRGWKRTQRRRRSSSSPR